MRTISLVAPGRLSGRVVLPASKSISNRVLMVDALAARGGQADVSHLDNLSDCDDTRVMCRWLSEWPEVIDIGAAGTAMRFSTALLSVTEGCHVLTGSERMCHRPIGILVDALRSLGASIDYVGEEGFPPLRVTGRTGLRGGRLSLSGSVSSQYVSALLMIGPVLCEGLLLHLDGDIVSRPYIDLTLSVMGAFGAKTEWVDERTIRVAPTGYVRRNYRVESDWSAASYWYEMVALTDDVQACVTLPALCADSAQGDRRIADLFDGLGVRTEYLSEGGEPVVRLTKQAVKWSRVEADLVTVPDMAQTLVVTCAMLHLPFRFTGLQSLRIKETDRLQALCVELSKLGFAVEERAGSELVWDGTLPVLLANGDNVFVDTYEDHRMAMAFAPCALRIGSIGINQPQVVSKSYPNYWKDLERMGFSVALIS